MGTLVDLRSRLETESNASRAGCGARARPLLRRPELADLRALCEAVELGSIGAAARSLSVSQPALSKRLRRLELVAGTPLLCRSTCGVRPTASGLRLYRAAQRLLVAAGEVESVMSSFDPAGTAVRLAASRTISESWLPGVLADLELLPTRGISIELSVATSPLVHRMVYDGLVDVGLAAIDPEHSSSDGLTETVIGAEEVVVAVPPSHMWRNVEEIEPEAFACTPVIQQEPGSSSSRVVELALARLGLAQVAPVAEIASTAAAVASALAWGTPALLPASVAADHAGAGLMIRRLRGAPFQYTVAVLHRGELNDLRPSVRRLVHHVLAAKQPNPRLVPAEACAVPSAAPCSA